MNVTNLSVLELVTPMSLAHNPDGLSMTTKLALNKLLISVLEVQNDVNVKMGGDAWVDSDNEYITALHVETAECIESIGYEWWKKRTEDRVNTLVELCDIFTFLISHSMQQNDVPSLLLGLDAFTFHDSSIAEIDKEDRNQEARYLLRGLTTETECYDSGAGLVQLARICLLLDFSFKDLILTYLCKAKLNKFRTANGYKEGKYEKIWEDGKEDNYHMMKLLLSEEGKKFDSNLLIDWVFAGLEEHYKTHVA